MASGVDKVVDRLVELCEEHQTLPWNCPYLNPKQGVMGAPQNPATGTVYSGGNRMWLSLVQWAKGYRTPYFTTFKGALALGGCVLKGQKGYPIVIARPVTHKNDDGEDEVSRVYFGHTTVFNLDQIEHIDMEPYLPETPESPGPTGPECPDAESFWAAVSPSVTIVPGTKPAYSPGEDAIRMPPVENFVSQAAYWKSLFHELTHWTGHETRLNRDLKNGFGTEKYSKEELVAEIGAAVIAQTYLGDDGADMTESAAYVKSWLNALKQNPKWLYQAATDAEKAVAFICTVPPRREVVA